MEDWAEIRRLHRAERLPIKEIARVLGCSKNTKKAALASAGPPRYERAARGSIVDAVEPRVRELLAVYPRMLATVIAERVGWDRSLTVLKERVRELRPVYLPPDPASRTAYVAGEIGQCDLWFPDITLPVGCGQSRTVKALPVLVMVTGYARWLSALLLPSRCGQDLFAGWWRLLEALQVSVLTEATHAFRGTLGARALICNPGDPEAKGLVERANGYLETSFLPGRTFTGPTDFNTQLAGWTALVNTRRRRTVVPGICAGAETQGRGTHLRNRMRMRRQLLGTPAAAPRSRLTSLSI